MNALETSLRVGLGTDCHRLAEGLPLWLGGVEILSKLGSVAHSDGDVVLHALIDALLGTVSMGDIGEHFPPSNPAFKNARSADLLAQTLQLIQVQHPGFQVINVDATVQLEQPKLSPYKGLMVKRLAELLSISASQVSLKAKTAEGLGPVGLSQAIEAQVVVLVSL